MNWTARGDHHFDLETLVNGENQKLISETQQWKTLPKIINNEAPVNWNLWSWLSSPLFEFCIWKSVKDAIAVEKVTAQIRMWKLSMEIAGSESSRVLNEAWTEHRVRLVITQSFWVMSRVFMTCFIDISCTKPIYSSLINGLSHWLTEQTLIWAMTWKHDAELWNVLCLPETDVVSAAFKSKLSRSFQHDGAPEIERSEFRADDEWKRNVGMETREKNMRNSMKIRDKRWCKC